MPSASNPPPSSKKSGKRTGKGRDAGQRTILERWGITADDLTRIVGGNPSLRGMLFGYVAEFKLTQLLDALDHVSDSIKYDDHDRTKKGDRVVSYKGHRVIIESKSLQTNTVRRIDDRWIGKVQVDASDRRVIKLPDKTRLNTTLLLAGEFDILAVNVFEFEKNWRFVFARNRDLPRSSFSGYSSRQRNYLLASLMTVSWPPEPPFHDDIVPLLEEVARERRR